MKSPKQLHGACGDSGLHAGDEVRIQFGPMQGRKAVVTSVNERHRIAAVELNLGCLRVAMWVGLSGVESEFVVSDERKT